MRPVAFLLALVLLAGCGGRPVPRAPPDTYLEDAVGDAPPNFDIVRANFTELNGSLVLRIEIDNYATELPLVVAVIETSLGDYYVRTVLEPSRVRADQGRSVDDEPEEPIETCWLRSFPSNPDSPEPWWIFLEFLNNRTGFTDAGGTVSSLTVVTEDRYGQEMDDARHEGAFRAVGGPNPYAPDCPLNKERGRLV